MRRIAAALAMATFLGCVSGEVTKKEAVVEMKARTPRTAEMRKRVAVADFLDKTAYGKGQLGTGASDILTNYLVKSQQFRVFERQQISKALDEQKFQQSGVVDAKTAVQVGKMIGAEYVVYGAITNFGIRTESTNAIFYQNKKQIAESQVDVRIINVETGEVVYSMDGRGQAEREASGSMGLGGSMGYDQTLAGDSLRASIVKMMDDMIDSMP